MSGTEDPRSQPGSGTPVAGDPPEPDRSPSGVVEGTLGGEVPPPAEPEAERSPLARLARHPVAQRAVVLVVAGAALGATIGYTVTTRDAAVATQPLRGVSQVAIVSLRAGEPRGTATQLAVTLAPLPGVVQVSAPQPAVVKVYVSSKAAPQQISSLEAVLSKSPAVATFVLEGYSR